MNSRGVARPLLAASLVRCLGPGWEVVDPATTSVHIAVTLERPLGGDFTAVAELAGHSTRGSDRFPVELGGLTVGVAYEPLKRLAPLLGGSFSGALVLEPAERVLGVSQTWPMVVANADDAASTMSNLAPMIEPAAEAFVCDYMTVGSLLEETQDDLLVTAALLAASGQFDRAAKSLGRYNPDESVRPSVRRQQVRATYQLGRWIAARGDEALVPIEPAEDPEQRELEDIVEWLPAKAAATIARLAAIRAVQQRAGGKSRDALREELVAEFGLRGVVETPLGIERALQQLTDDRKRSSWHAGREVADALAATREQLKATGPEHSSRLSPPAHALYRVPVDVQSPWDPVDIDATEVSWLAQAYELGPRVGDIMYVDAWLDLPDVAASVPRRLSVNIGARRVGSIQSLSPYVDVVEAAARRAELPCLPARVSRPSDSRGYLLEIGRPGRTH